MFANTVLFALVVLFTFWEKLDNVVEKVSG